MPDDGRTRPEWAPEDGGDAFASRVMKGVEGGHDGMPAQSAAAFSRRKPLKRRVLTAADYVRGIRAGDRTLLARAITLIESNNPAHEAVAQEVLRELLPHAGKSVRVGITGVPGVGKSTFIEALGNHLCDRGHKVAVLAVDPSSSVTHGSILGDKTRMELLSRRPEAFIRPSPSGGTLGGVARKSRETVVLCEAFGFDVILLETVGVGQSETTVRSMVDFFLLLQIAGAGDELQGIKKGVIEIADAIVVNKADGDNLQRAKLARAEYARVLQFLHPATEGWKTPARICSGLSGEGVGEIWDTVLSFVDLTRASGVFQARRRRQDVEWFHAMIEEALRARFYAAPGMRERIRAAESAVADGRLPAASAVAQVIDAYGGLTDDVDRAGLD